MSNTAEIVEKLTKELTLHKTLDLATECETLEEFIEKLKLVIERN